MSFSKLFAIFLLFAANVSAQDEIKNLKLTPENYPRVNGSTSTYPLGILLSARLNNWQYEWVEDEFNQRQKFIRFAHNEENTPEHISKMYEKIAHYGTNQGYMALVENAADIILVARAPSSDEFKAASDNGMIYEYKPVAMDAFVFIVNAGNPTNDITIEQIQSIYTGKLTNWLPVSGWDREINAYNRERNSGSLELMQSLVMKDLQMIDAPSMILYGMMGPINTLKRDSSGLGFSVYYYEEFIAPNEQLKRLAINGIFPNKESIQNRTYPLNAEVYAVIRGDLDKNSAAYKMYEWLSTEEGQKVIAESGYIPIN